MNLEAIFPEVAKDAAVLHFDAPRKRPKEKPLEVWKIDRCPYCGHLKGNHEQVRKNPPTMGSCSLIGCACKGKVFR